MDGKKKGKQDADSAPAMGRDDMRLLEYSIASASNKVDRKTGELVFTDWVKNPATKQDVQRSVRLVFSGKYGRPTSLDDDVFVALLKLSHEAGFESSIVHFTRTDICRILQWETGGAQYRRIENALDRWIGVQIYAENYFFDELSGGMVDRKFGIIDDIELQARERIHAVQRNGAKVPKSWFRWSNVMQETFEAGMIRKLDFEEYNAIENGMARKLYRYLGKYFWQNKTQQFDLAELTHQKLGMNRIKDAYELKRRVKPAIEELEELGFITPDSDRYVKAGNSVQVRFQAASAKTKYRSRRVPPLEAELLEIGINAKAATDFAARLSPERVREDIDHARLLDKRGEIRASTAGFLFKLLDAPEPWPRPKGFKTVVERKEAKQKLAALESNKRQAEDSRRQAEIVEQERVEAYLKNIRLEGQLDAFRQEALNASKFSNQQYHRAKDSGDDDAASVYLESAMKALAEKRMDEDVCV